MTRSRPGGTPGATRRAPSRSAGAAGGVRPGAARPSSARPAPAARGRRPRGEQRTPRSVRRILVIGSIFIMLAVTLVPTLRSYLRQQGQIAAMQAQVAQQGTQVESLRKQAAQWDDPAYVEQQARQRLKFVRPGERSYTVIDAAPPSAAADEPKIASLPPGAGQHAPWYGQLWQSMVIADSPPAKVPAPAPDTRRPTVVR